MLIVTPILTLSLTLYLPLIVLFSSHFILSDLVLSGLVWFGLVWQGVNSGLEDVFELYRELQNSKNDVVTGG
jgi:hypothetical protein